MWFIAAWWRQNIPAKPEKVWRGLPYEVIGKTDDGRFVHELVWAKDFWEARTLVAKMHNLSSRVLVRAYELLMDEAGEISRALNGNPIRKFE